MNKPAAHSFVVDEETPAVIVAALRSRFPELSWSKIRKLIRSRRVTVGNVLCLDESRKLNVNERVEVYDESLRQPPTANDVRVHYVDRDLVVVDKPPRMVTLRHKKERSWHRSKKQRQPALEEVVPDLIYADNRTHRPALYSVHRIDRDTSGLLVFARNPRVQQALIAQFAAHDVVRVYNAIAYGTLQHQTVRCRLVRDRGDGLRGSSPQQDGGKESVTHIRPQRTFSFQGHAYTEVDCQLETGRTHQIRIHLAELGHPVCGDAVYRAALGEDPIPDESGAPRLALHATRLGFTHPTNDESLHFSSPWPADMGRFIARLGEDSSAPERRAASKGAP